MFDILGLEKKSPVEILEPLKNKIAEALGHEPERFSLDFNLSEGTFRISSEGRHEEMKNKPLVSIASKLLKSEMKKSPLHKNKDFDIVRGSIYWEKGKEESPKISMAIFTKQNEVLTTEF